MNNSRQREVPRSPTIRTYPKILLSDRIVIRQKIGFPYHTVADAKNETLDNGFDKLIMLG